MEDEKKPRSRSKAKAEETQTPPSESNLSAREAAEVFEAAENPAASPAAEDVPPVATSSAEIPTDTTAEPPDLTLEEPLAQAAEEGRTDPPAPPPSAPPAEVASQSGSQGGGFWPTLAGGVVAAALGFGVAYFLLPRQSGDPALESRVAEQARQISTLRSEIAALPAPVDLGGVEQQIARLSSTLSEGETARESLTSRIAALESRPATAASTGDAPSADVTAALESLRSDLSTQAERNAALSDEVETLRSSAAGSARAAEGEAIVARIRMAIELGTGFVPAVERLGQLGVDVPAPLKDASEGVASLSDLRRDFPNAARAGLDASYRATGEESFGDRAEMFLRSQLGIRSLTPQAGDSPDAVLSRANAAVQAGQIDEALTEIASLPAAGQAAMAGWVAAATTRVSAQKAADEVVAGLTRN